MLKRLCAVLFSLLLVGSGMVSAQEAGVPVPDLTGMTVPVAAAVLNSNGLSLGAEMNEGWTPESGMEQNRVKGQSLPAGQSAAPGSVVDVTVLRSPNVILIYDDNDFTLVNQTGAQLTLAGLSFNALDGASASLAATRWANILRVNQCVQVWSVGRNGSKGMDECDTIQNWLVTTNPGEHFWTGEGGTTRFNVTQNGVERVSCPVANPGRCEFYVSGGASADTTQYIYFAYTPEHLAVINQSADQWMSLANFNVFNNYGPAKHAPVPLGDPTLYVNKNPVARFGLLAPGQCTLFTNSNPEANQPPQPCTVVANLAVDPNLIFWGAAFDMTSSDGASYSCPAATADKLTICVMPR